MVGIEAAIETRRVGRRVNLRQNTNFPESMGAIAIRGF